MIIYNASIVTMDSAPIERGFVEVSGGKIAGVHGGVPNDVNGGDIDAEMNTLYPGFIDAHSHLGFIGGGDGVDESNETGEPSAPHLRAIDGFNFADRCFRDAAAAGVTAAVIGPGSANPIGGDCIAVKTRGASPDEMYIRQSGVKFALGENPKRAGARGEKGPRTRMAAAAVIREALFKARRYRALLNAAGNDVTKLPEFDIKSESLLPLINGELKAFFHCHRADDILTAVRIAREFDLAYALIHCTAGHTIARTLGRERAAAVVGPVISGFDKLELADNSARNAAILHENGVKVAVCTDHSETPVQYLLASAAFCVKAGLPRGEALKAVTINAAETAGIADRTGTVTAGKDADLVLLDGDPFDIKTNVVFTMINGEIAYNAK
jgi:imidazolonepropionase-like amidohydrolase